MIFTRISVIGVIFLCALETVWAQHSPGFVDERRYIYLGKNDVMLHLVWEEHPSVPVQRYVIEKSYDGNHFFAVDSVQPVNLFDIHVNDYPQDINYYNRILYSTETGGGRFIYNDVRDESEAGEKNFWFRIKMVKPDGGKIYTRTELKSFSFGIADIDHLRELGGSGEEAEGEGTNGTVAFRRSSGPCPNIQDPPAGYIFNGGVRTFYGECCYWEEREYMAQQITEACGGLQAWCCPVDCSPLSSDPCCVHICTEYGQCSCHPWDCCDVANSSIWVVTASTTYSMTTTVDSLKHVSCNGLYDGEAYLTTTGGIEPYSYNWTSGPNNGSFLNGLQAGAYDVTVTDFNACTTTASFTISQPPVLAATLNPIHSQCFGFNTGSIDLNVTGGTPNYIYDWSTGIPTQDQSGLSPANYTVTVTDQNGCQTFGNINILEPVEFTGTVSVIDIQCYGWATGTAVLSHILGGAPPYRYLWSTGDTTISIEGLLPGTYHLTTTDANGCSFTSSGTVTQLPPITVNITSQLANCNVCNGSATATPSGGSGVYNYEWATTPLQHTQTAINLCAGIVSLVVSDANASGCAQSYPVAISNIGAQSVSLDSTDASCTNVCDGIATVTFTGGCSSPPCSVAWFDGVGTNLNQSTLTATNLCAGNHLVRVTNGLGCITSATLLVGSSPDIVVTVNVTNQSCPSVCNGAATAVPSGGSGAYTYQWRDANGTPIPLQTNPSVSNLCPGDYSVRVLDTGGCETVVDFAILPYYSLVTATPADARCSGSCDGTITANMIGGTGPFHYQWFDVSNNPIADTNQTAFNLCAGSYYVQVTSAAGCVLTSPAVTINEPAAVTATMSKTDIQCAGQCTGTASVTAGGGTGPYIYQWYSAGNVLLPNEVNATISNLCEGAYSVIITDATGCEAPPQQVNIVVLTTIELDFAALDISCFNVNDGSIDVTVTDGTTPLSFSWNNGAYITQNLSGLSDGVYTLIVTDANGCTATESATIVNPLPISVTASPYQYPNGHVSCTDYENGRATAVATGGTVPHNFLWSDGQPAPTAIGLELGTYTVTVTDARGCSATTDVTLNINPPPLLTNLTALTYIGGWNVSCPGASDGSIDLTVTNGNPPLVYEWLPLHIVFVEDLANVPADTYYVSVTDTVAGCNVWDTITLTEPPLIDLTFQTMDASCRGAENGEIDLTATGGTPVYSYSWEGEGGAFITEDLTGLAAGTYAVSVTDTNGCVMIDSALVNEPTHIPVGNVYLGTCRDSFFIGGAYQTVSGVYYDTVQYGVGCDSVVATDLEFVTSFFVPDTVRACGDSYFVGGALQTADGIYYDTLIAAGICDSVIETNLMLLPEYFVNVDTSICDNQFYFAGGAEQNETGTYIDSLLSAAGCDSIIETALTVIDVEINIQPDSTIVRRGDPVEISVIGGAGNLIYNWSPTDGLTCTNCSTATIEAVNDVIYTVVATDEMGCADTAVVLIYINDTLEPRSEFPLFYVPNAFTPDGDGNNDEFRVIVTDYASFRLLIFNRWGEKLFETTNPMEGWDGTYRGEQLNPGVYVYYVDIGFINNVKPPDYLKYNKGSLTLIR